MNYFKEGDYTFCYNNKKCLDNFLEKLLDYSKKNNIENLKSNIESYFDENSDNIISIKDLDIEKYFNLNSKNGSLINEIDNKSNCVLFDYAKGEVYSNGKKYSSYSSDHGDDLIGYIIEVLPTPDNDVEYNMRLSKEILFYLNKEIPKHYLARFKDEDIKNEIDNLLKFIINTIDSSENVTLFTYLSN